MNNDMMHERKELDRLDLAAKALVAESALPRLGVISFVLSLMFAGLAIASTASHAETVAVRGIAVVSALTTIMLWAHWRYSLHLDGVLFVMIAVGTLFFHPHSHSALGWLSGLAYCPSFIFCARHLWKLGSPFGATRGKEWREEQSQAREWLRTLESQNAPDRVLEVHVGSFWTGYTTYRLLSDGNCWAVARFKKGNLNRLLDYRVRNMTAVRLTDLDDGRRVEINNRFIGRIRPAIGG